MDYCPELPSLVSQKEKLYYNACLTFALPLVQAVHAINSVLRNKQCNNSALPFFCKAVFSICGNDSFFTNLTEECVTVRDNDCSVEWRVLENIFDISIPSCESFTINKGLVFAKAPPLKCPDQFNVFCSSVCLPVCEQYSQVSHGATVASTVLVIIFIIIGIIGGLITLIACICNREKMYVSGICVLIRRYIVKIKVYNTLL